MDHGSGREQVVHHDLDRERFPIGSDREREREKKIDVNQTFSHVTPFQTDKQNTCVHVL